MKIKGIQELTLIDYPDKIACTIFLYGCNFRCGFCHNPELVVSENIEDISENEILEFLEKRKGNLEGVCITGGEPLINLDKDFLRKIKDLGYLIKIDTNGSFPERLKEFIEEDLVDFVAMDIKSSKEKYLEVVNSNVDLRKIEESIKLISGLEDYEFRTTIVEDLHPIEEVKKIGKWLNALIGKPKKFVLQGFKNKGKFIDEKYNSERDVGENYLNSLMKEIENFFEKVEIRV